VFSRSPGVHSVVIAGPYGMMQHPDCALRLELGRAKPPIENQDRK
jgi:hypothetical protein